MKTIGLVAKSGKPEALPLARQLRERYPNLTFLVERHLAEALGWGAGASGDEIAAGSELLIVMGGDGTLIHGARLLRGRPVPILGVNLGSLGFMTEIPQQELLPVFEDVLAERHRVVSRIKLTCRLWRGGKAIVEDEVLNDVVINKGALARIADHETSVEGQYVTTYKSDGVIVATPTGSTAYSLSAGGPIVYPTVDSVIVTPICSHALTQRSLVIPSDKVINIVVKSESADVYLTIDGQTGHEMKTGDRLEVQRSPNRVLLVRNPKMDYFAILRTKLKWGER